MNMKTFKFIAILLALCSCFVSCKNKEEYNSKGKYNSLEMGVYIETYPINGRTIINFIDQGKLVIIKDEDVRFQDEFYYEICLDTIKLTLVQNSTGMDRRYFHIVNNQKFEIENLYMNLPENTRTNMIFIKEKN